MEAYKPVSCGFVDRIEDLATRKVSGKVVFRQDGEVKEVESRIVSWENVNKEEFLILENDVRIRLDQVVELCGIPGPAYLKKP